MPQIKVTSGDIERGPWRFTTVRGVCRMHRTTAEDWFRPTFIDYGYDVTAIRELSQDEFADLSRREGWAVSRGPVRGTLRWLVETVMAERNPDIGFTARMRDGRAFTAVTDHRTWHRLRVVVNR